MKILMLRGLQGSGKSTFCNNLTKTDKNWLRVNRDSIRKDFFGGIWSRDREKTVVAIEKNMVKTMIENGFSVVIDDTNVSAHNQNLWKEFAREYSATFETKIMDTSIEECIHRDSLRTGSERIGQAIICKTALFNDLINWNNKPILIVDLDGTIADGSHREQYLLPEKKNWNMYFSLMSKDSPIEKNIAIVKELAKTHTICVVTGRPDTYQYDTIDWIRKIAKLEFDYIFMRSSNDRRPDYVVKGEIVSHIPITNIATTAIDDKESVIEAYKKLGINVIHA
jgi:predicted kinase